VTYQRLAIRVRRSCRPPAGPARRKRREGRPRVSPRPPRAGGCEFQVGQGRGPGARQSGPQGAQRPQHGQGLQLCRGRVGRERARGLYRCPSLNQVRRKVAGRRRPAGEGHDADDGTSARRWLPSARAGCAPGGVMPSRCPTPSARGHPRACAAPRCTPHCRSASASGRGCVRLRAGGRRGAAQAGRARGAQPAEARAAAGAVRRGAAVWQGGGWRPIGLLRRALSLSVKLLDASALQGSSARFQFKVPV
jgi:hypothetical protein